MGLAFFLSLSLSLFQVDRVKKRSYLERHRPVPTVDDPEVFSLLAHFKVSFA